MKYLKKYPLFFTLTIALCVLFVAGLAFDIYLFRESKSATLRLQKSMRAYQSALSEDPTPKAIDDSNANIKKLEARLNFLEKDLTRAHTDIFKPLTASQGYQLVEQLRGMVNKWRYDAKALGIAVPSEMDFAFKKYVAPSATPPVDGAVPALWKQACVLDYIMKKLYACKSEESPMIIMWVQREILKEEAVAVSRKPATTSRVSAASRRKAAPMGDNFEIDKNISSRKEGSLDTIAYRFVFAGHTDVLRRFLNQLKDFDAMLVVRSIDVRPADKSAISAISKAPVEEESENGAANALFGGNNENGESTEAGAENADTGISVENRTPVVTDNISEFTVVIEYVEVVKDAPKVAEEGNQQKKSK